MSRLKIFFLFFFICIFKIQTQVVCPILKEFVTDNARNIAIEEIIFTINNSSIDKQIKVTEESISLGWVIFLYILFTLLLLGTLFVIMKLLFIPIYIYRFYCRQNRSVLFFCFSCCNNIRINDTINFNACTCWIICSYRYCYYLS